MPSKLRVVRLLCVVVTGVWLSALCAEEPLIELDAEERAWVAAHPVVRVGYDPDWLPFSHRTAQGEFAGIDADLLALLGQRLGLRFEAVTHRSWPEAYQAGLDGRVDLLVGISRTPQRERAFHFTNAYISFPVGIITRTSEDFFWTVLDLDGRVIASPHGYVTTEELARNYPHARLQLVDSVGAALEAVSEGRADAAVTNLANASFIIKTRGLSNLKISGVLPETFELRYAVRPDAPVLLRILDKGIASLAREDLQALNHRWVRVDYAKVIRWDIVWKSVVAVVGVLGVVIAFLAWHNRAVRTELAKRKLVQQALEASNARLNLANDQLMARHEEISGLMRVAAHDLRSPLTAITLSGGLLHDSVGGDLRAPAEIILSSARQMMGLIDDLLEVHALEHGQRKFSLSEQRLPEVVRASVASLEPLARRKKITFAPAGLDDGGDDLWVLGDVGALRQVFDNLLSNALKFSPRESVVALRALRWGEFARIEVIDQGPGVPAGERERIFTKYARGTARPTGGEKSTGLGLAIVRESVAAHNGRVWVQDAPAGAGACFVVALPLRPHPAVAVSAPAVPPLCTARDPA